MSIIDKDDDDFINHIDVRITQPILRWALITLEEQRLVRIAHFRIGGTFPYIHHNCRWLTREIRGLTDLETSIEKYINSLFENLDEININHPRENLPQEEITPNKLY